jgi:hypothetical protein
VEFLSQVDEVRNAPEVSLKDREKALILYRRFQEIDPDTNCIYPGYADGTLLINDYLPPGGYDPRIRPWYLATSKPIHKPPVVFLMPKQKAESGWFPSAKPSSMTAVKSAEWFLWKPFWKRFPKYYSKPLEITSLPTVMGQGMTAQYSFITGNFFGVSLSRK